VSFLFQPSSLHHFATVTEARSKTFIFYDDLINDLGNTISSTGHCDSSFLDGIVIDGSGQGDDLLLHTNLDLGRLYRFVCCQVRFDLGPIPASVGPQAVQMIATITTLRKLLRR
jgi:hypothetical protein